MNDSTLLAMDSYRNDTEEEMTAEEDPAYYDGFIKAECHEYWREVEGLTLSGANLAKAVLVVTATIDDDKVLEPDVYEYVFEVAPMDPGSLRRHIDIISSMLTPERWRPIINGIVTDPEKNGYVEKSGYHKDYTLKRSYKVYVRRITYKKR